MGTNRMEGATSVPAEPPTQDVVGNRQTTVCPPRCAGAYHAFYSIAGLAVFRLRRS